MKDREKKLRCAMGIIMIYRSYIDDYTLWRAKKSEKEGRDDDMIIKFLILFYIFLHFSFSLDAFIHQLFYGVTKWPLVCKKNFKFFFYEIFQHFKD